MPRRARGPKCEYGSVGDPEPVEQAIGDRELTRAACSSSGHAGRSIPSGRAPRYSPASVTNERLRTIARGVPGMSMILATRRSGEGLGPRAVWPIWCGVRMAFGRRPQGCRNERLARQSNRAPRQHRWPDSQRLPRAPFVDQSAPRRVHEQRAGFHAEQFGPAQQSAWMGLSVACRLTTSLVRSSSSSAARTPRASVPAVKRGEVACTEMPHDRRRLATSRPSCRSRPDRS